MRAAVRHEYGPPEVLGVDGPDELARLRRIGADHGLDQTAESFTENGERYGVLLVRPLLSPRPGGSAQDQKN